MRYPCEQRPTKMLTFAMRITSGNYKNEAYLFDIISAAITTESAIRYLKEFEKEKILKLVGKDIQIVDASRLNDIAKKG